MVLITDVNELKSKLTNQLSLKATLFNFSNEKAMYTSE